MRLLLDTHAFLWWIAGDAALSERARRVIEDEGNPVYVSAASAWEISTKHRIGKLPGAAGVATDLGSAISDQGFIDLSISVRHAQIAGACPALTAIPSTVC